MDVKKNPPTILSNRSFWIVLIQCPGCHRKLKFTSNAVKIWSFLPTTMHVGGQHDIGCIILQFNHVVLDHSSASTHKLTMTNWVIENLVHGIHFDMGPAMNHSITWASKDLPPWHMYTSDTIVLLIPLFSSYELAGYHSSRIGIIATSSCPSAYYSYWSACNYF